MERRRRRRVDGSRWVRVGDRGGSWLGLERRLVCYSSLILRELLFDDHLIVLDLQRVKRRQFRLLEEVLWVDSGHPAASLDGCRLELGFTEVATMVEEDL